MTFCVYLVIVLLAVTKLFDAVSTHLKLGHLEGETNPIARRMMSRYGTAQAIWAVFALALIIIGAAGVAALKGSSIMKILFIIAGTVISIIQGAVAHCNWTGQDNPITKRIRAFHLFLNRTLSK